MVPSQGDQTRTPTYGTAVPAAQRIPYRPRLKTAERVSAWRMDPKVSCGRCTKFLRSRP